MTKTTNERITSYDEQIAQLQNRKKKLLQKQKADERKVRTRRLIERGAILESYIDGVDEMTNDQIASILKKTVGSSVGARIITETKEQKTEKLITAPQGETPKRNGETAEPEVVKTNEVGGSVSAQRAEMATESD